MLLLRASVELRQVCVGDVRVSERRYAATLLIWLGLLDLCWVRLSGDAGALVC